VTATVVIVIGLILVSPGVIVEDLVSPDAASVTEIVQTTPDSRSKLNTPFDLVKLLTVVLPEAVAVTNAQTSFTPVELRAVP
jgi:hypothetical protein